VVTQRGDPGELSDHGARAHANSDELRGRVALVTGGAGAAIGSATCRMLAGRGAAVVVLDESERRTHATAQALTEEFGTPAFPLVADVADRAAIDEGLDRSASELGTIDILVNSAAVNVQGSIFEYRPDDWDRVIDVDLTAPWYLMRMLMPGMRDRGWGAIVNVTSVAAYMGGRGREGPYSAAKAGLHDLTRAAAIEGGPFGIRCNAVAPGLVRSKWVDKQADRYQTFIDATPLRRHGEPDDVANTIGFLISEQAAHITGQIINVSGGWYLTP
jgi:NAD(P)-dependent dehydrogenase (short-subunit alcohol dehydrogenase family)